MRLRKQHFSHLLLSLQPTPGQEMLSTGERDPGGGPQSRFPARPQGTRRPLLWPWCCRHRGAEPFRAPRQGPHPGSSHARHQPCLPGGRDGAPAQGRPSPAPTLSFPSLLLLRSRPPPSRDHVWHAHVSVTLPLEEQRHVSRLARRGQGPGLDSGRGVRKLLGPEPEHWALRHGGVCTGVCRGPETQPARSAPFRRTAPWARVLPALGALVSLETRPTCGHLGDIAGLAQMPC